MFYLFSLNTQKVSQSPTVLRYKISSELAAFYTKLTKSPDQACSATYLISGEYMFPFSCNANTGSRSKKKANGCLLDMDIDSDSSPYDFTPTQSQSQSQPPLKPHFKECGNVEGGKKGNKDVVVQIRLTVVGEAELGGRYVYLSAFVFVSESIISCPAAKAKYTKVNSVTLYSLSPAPIRVSLNLISCTVCRLIGGQYVE